MNDLPPYIPEADQPVVRKVEKTLAGRLLNAAERITDGLSPREECVDLFLEAHKRIDELEEAAKADIVEGKSEVDQALKEFGYDSLRFADVRHGWICGTRRMRELLK